MTILKKVAAHQTPLTVAGIFAGLLLWCGWYGWELTTRLSHANDLTAGPTIAPTPKPTADYDLIAGTPIFGSAEPAASSTSAVSTDLALVLRAAFAAVEISSGAAIIEVSGQPAKFYKVGEELVPGVLLQEVLKDRVVLKRDNRLESLSFPVPSTQALAQVAPETLQQTLPPPTDPVPAPNAGASDYSALAAYVGGESTADTIRKRLEDLRRRAQEARAQRQAMPPDQGE